MFELAIHKRFLKLKDKENLTATVLLSKLLDTYEGLTIASKK